MFNHSKAQWKSKNDAPEFTEEHFRNTSDVESGSTELLCGYLFSVDDNSLYAVNGTNKRGELILHKSPMHVGGDGILHWTAFLTRMMEERQHPTPYGELWQNLGVSDIGEREDAAARAESGESISGNPFSFNVIDELQEQKIGCAKEKHDA